MEHMSGDLRRFPFQRSRSLSPPGMASEDSVAKKAKLEVDIGDGDPSPVVHIRNLPMDVTENEILMLGLPFGKVRNVLHMKKKQQAFMELVDEGAAMSVVGYYKSVPATIRGKTVYVQFSKHKELKRQGHASGFSSIDEPHVPQPRPPPLVSHSPPPPGEALGWEQTDTQTNSILKVVVENMLYPVNLDVLHQVFSKYGAVLKILTFVKNDRFNALIQFAMISQAIAAKQKLDGLNVYTGCCSLKIEYSNLPNLIITHNSDKARDFTQPSLGVGRGLGDAGRSGDLPPPPPRERAPLDLPGMDLPYERPALYDRPAYSEREYDRHYGRELDRRGALPSASHGRYHDAGLFDRPPSPRYRGSSSASSQKQGRVILVTNLNEALISPHTLFILFGAYGDVLRVKIIYNKKNTALIEMCDSYQAQVAMQQLNGAKLHGQPIRTSYSKYDYVEMPREEDAEYTKDYSRSKLHRFSKPGSKNCQNIFPPSAVLHLSNLPLEIEEEKLREIFTSRGMHVTEFKFFPKDRRMALITLESTEEGIKGLTELHDFELDDAHHLRVSFSKARVGGGGGGSGGQSS